MSDKIVLEVGQPAPVVTEETKKTKNLNDMLIDAKNKASIAKGKAWWKVLLRLQ